MPATVHDPLNWAEAEKRILAKKRNRSSGVKLASNLHVLVGGPSKYTGKDAIYLRYHQTNIVEYFPDGSALLDPDGWHTPTVKRHLSAYTFCDVHQRDGVWMVDGLNIPESVRWLDRGTERRGAWNGGVSRQEPVAPFLWLPSIATDAMPATSLILDLVAPKFVPIQAAILRDAIMDAGTEVPVAIAGLADRGDVFITNLGGILRRRQSQL